MLPLRTYSRHMSLPAVWHVLPPLRDMMAVTPRSACRDANNMIIDRYSRLRYALMMLRSPRHVRAVPHRRHVIRLLRLFQPTTLRVDDAHRERCELRH